MWPHLEAGNVGIADAELHGAEPGLGLAVVGEHDLGRHGQRGLGAGQRLGVEAVPLEQEIVVVPEIISLLKPLGKGSKKWKFP